MAVNHLFGIAAVAALILTSCVYPFEPAIETVDNRLVVEGSVSIGGTSSFSFSRVIPFTSGEYVPAPLWISGYIEGEDGVKVKGVSGPQAGSSLVFDTSGLSPSQKYRVHFDNSETGASYESDWLEVCDKPVIDDLRYILDHDRHELNVALSMHCSTQSHFRWYFEETWEYNVELWASHYLVPSEMYVPVGGEYHPELAVHKFESGENRYYCWKTLRSPVVKIISTSEQSDNRFTDLEFHRVSSSSDKLQIVYRLTLYFEAISEDAFLYWKNIEDNSQNQGTIFSPVPSQMKGNLHCISDPSADVIGYVNASQLVSAQMYYDNSQEDFYDGPGLDWRSVEIVEFTDPNEFVKLYPLGYLPYTVILPEMGGDGSVTYQWAKARCVDCTERGGTKVKPEGWPNNHI